jgi:hypothetical protein
MTRTIGYVPVRVGRGVIPVPVEAEANAHTHIDYPAGGTAKIVVPEGLTMETANKEVEAVLPEIEKLLARKLLN